MKLYTRAASYTYSHYPERESNYAGFSREDIDLHESIDWKSRDYKDYPVPGDTFRSQVHVYGLDNNPYAFKNFTFQKFLRANPIFPPYYKPIDFDDSGLVGPMFDGREYDGYDIHDRYETSELYDMLSR